MLTLLLISLAVGIALMLIGIQRGRFSAGMPLAYFLGLSLIHVPGAAVYVDFPKWDGQAYWTQLGFEQTVTGMVAFLIGVLIARYTSFQSRLPQPPKVFSAPELAVLDRIALLYVFGGIGYFLLSSFISIPSLNSLIAQLSSLIIVGSSLRLWVARQQRDYVKFWVVVLLLPFLPAITIIRGGFIAIGTYWLLSSVSFAFAQSKQRSGYFLVAPLVVFLGLSVFVNYMASRTEYRAAAWIRQVGLEERIERFGNMFRNFEWYDSENSKHREVIDSRLNQNLIVGAAVDRLSSGAVDFANGSTIVDIVIALIPRALWPDKPQVGGGGTVVRDFTGMKFADGTSVGAGQVLEFYVNFGFWGVVGGFLIYGWLIGWMDFRIMDSLNKGDQKGFLLWFMMCLALLQPGGNLLEVVTSVVGSGITAKAIGYFVNRRFATQKMKSAIQLTLHQRG
jgi:hypothetical protein